jgi:Dyp-type peroxidase family
MVANPVKTHALELPDIQGLVLQGYGKHRAAAYLVLNFTNGARARMWLRTVLADVSFGDARPPGTALNVAVTAAGLHQLGVPLATMARFPLEFNEGMSSAHRSRLLGDVGAACPAQWTWGGPSAARVDALCLVFAHSEDELAEALAHYRTGLATHAVREVATLDTVDIGFSEHFGFRDGLSQPAISGVGAPAPAMHTLEPGEFLIGYRNEHGQYPPSPLVPADLDPRNLLPKRAPDPRGTAGAPVPMELENAHDLGRNGSYLVVRTLLQDVGALWRVADRVTRHPDGSADPRASIRLVAQMVGRWPSGAPLTKSPEADRPELADDNDFGYHDDDPDGIRCPIGAHVRRTNPRDSLPPKPGSSDSIDVNKRHRLIRRGRAFGPPATRAEALTEDPDRTPERGLHFLALCSDIARQFEFISHSWAMDPHFGGLLDDADPLLGGHAPQGRSFTVQQHPVRRRHLDVPAFVTPRGGAYFFLPGRRAMHYLSED